jgi:ABC-type microcin C transport system permease subunit YejB
MLVGMAIGAFIHACLLLLLFGAATPSFYSGMPTSCGTTSLSLVSSPAPKTQRTTRRGALPVLYSILEE